MGTKPQFGFFSSCSQLYHELLGDLGRSLGLCDQLPLYPWGCSKSSCTTALVPTCHLKCVIPVFSGLQTDVCRDKDDF